jgi:hypothetical protein
MSGTDRYGANALFTEAETQHESGEGEAFFIHHVMDEVSGTTWHTY